MNSYRPARPAYLVFLPGFLFAIDPSPARYIGRAWLLALLPSMVLATIAALTVGVAGTAPPADVTGPQALLLLVVIVPLLETSMMAVPLLILPRLIGAGPAVVLSAIAWGAMHSLVDGSYRALIAWWPFLIFSIAFLTWNQRGFLKANLVVAAIHGLQNSAAIGMLALLRLVSVSTGHGSG